MEIVQMQSCDAPESLAMMIPQTQLQIKIPRQEFADEKKDPSIAVEKKGEDAKEEEQERRVDRVQEECTTPKGEASRIPAPSVCPPPPARRTQRLSKRRREIPDEKFFPVPEDLNSVFIPHKKIRAG